MNYKTIKLHIFLLFALYSQLQALTDCSHNDRKHLDVTSKTKEEFHICLSNARLSIVKITIQNCSQWINLSSSDFKSLKSDISELTIKYTPIEFISFDLCSILNLTSLEVLYTRLKSFPDVSCFSKLIYLEIVGHNFTILNFTKIPATIKGLNLRDNGITTIANGSLDRFDFDYISLSDNKFICNQDLLWLKKWFEEHRKFSINLSKTYCHEPPELYGTQIDNLPDESFFDKPSPEPLEKTSEFFVDSSISASETTLIPTIYLSYATDLVDSTSTSPTTSVFSPYITDFGSTSLYVTDLLGSTLKSTTTNDFSSSIAESSSTAFYNTNLIGSTSSKSITTNDISSSIPDSTLNSTIMGNYQSLTTESVFTVSPSSIDSHSTDQYTTDLVGFTSKLISTNDFSSSIPDSNSSISHTTDIAETMSVSNSSITDFSSRFFYETGLVSSTLESTVTNDFNSSISDSVSNFLPINVSERISTIEATYYLNETSHEIISDITSSLDDSKTSPNNYTIFTTEMVHPVNYSANVSSLEPIKTVTPPIFSTTLLPSTFVTKTSQEIYLENVILYTSIGGGIVIIILLIGFVALCLRTLALKKVQINTEQKIIRDEDVNTLRRITKLEEGAANDYVHRKSNEYDYPNNWDHHSKISQVNYHNPLYSSESGIEDRHYNIPRINVSQRKTFHTPEPSPDYH